MVARKCSYKSIAIGILLSFAALAQQHLSSPARLDRSTLIGFNAGELRWQNADGTYFGFKGSPSGSNVTIQLPNSGPSIGTCLGYVSSTQLGWEPCSAGSSYDPTLGILMVNSTNTGVTGTGDGGHYYWDTTNHQVVIQSWFTGAVAPISMLSASHVDATSFHGNIVLATVPTLCGSGSAAQGVTTTINAAGCTVIPADPQHGILTLDGTNAGVNNTGIDGAHWFWDTVNHQVKIYSIFNPGTGAVPAPVNILASEVDSAIFKGNILLTTIPTVCGAGSAARGVDTSVNSTGCTLIPPDASNGIYMIGATTTNSANTTAGGHFNWDTGTPALNITAYTGGSVPAALNILGSTITLNANTQILAANILLPSLDNTNTLGSSILRWSDVRATTAHIGKNPLDIPTGTVFQAATDGLSLYVQDAYAGNIAAFVMRSASGSYSVPGGLTANATIGVMGVRGHDGSTWVANTTASVNYVTTGTAWSNVNHGTLLQFKITPDGSLSSQVEMSLDSTGISTVSLQGLGNRAVCVHSGGTLYAAISTTCP